MTTAETHRPKPPAFMGRGWETMQAVGGDSFTTKNYVLFLLVDVSNTSLWGEGQSTGLEQVLQRD